MSFITPQEVKDLTALICLDNDLLAIISSVEVKFIIPIITKPVYDDIAIKPDIYSVLLQVYIKPYLAFCVRQLYSSQYLSEALADETKDLGVLVETKKNLLVNHLISGIYPLYVIPKKKQISGFLIR